MLGALVFRQSCVHLLYSLNKVVETNFKIAGGGKTVLTYVANSNFAPKYYTLLYLT